MATPAAVVSQDPCHETQPVVRTGLLGLVLLSIGHFFIDLYSSALGALQPLLVAKLSLSLTQAGILGGVLVFSSSVAQPVYGYLSDRFHSRLFTVLAPAVAGVFISSLGLAPSYSWLLLLVFLGGAGIASFHPQASARVTLGVDAARARWMAVFISSGTMGMACGPTIFSLVPARTGLENVWVAGIPGVAATLLLFVFLKGNGIPSGTSRRFELGALRDVWKPLTLLYLLVFIRSIIQITYTQFLPLYLNHERGFPVTHASFALSLYLACGALGGFVGGSLADRIGGRFVILLSMVGSVPFLLVFFFSSGWLSMVGLALGGLVLLFTIPVNVVMAQRLAPKQVGTVSALMMGFAWGMAGLIFIPLTGALADRFGLHAVLCALAFFPIAGVFLTLKLPADSR
jgi:MFS transporter, FSR family, fosmidomycin resistance protein